MIKLVIIDFDDTLSMTEEACFFLENDAAGRLGYPPMSRDDHRANWGQPLEHAILERIPGIDADEFMSVLTWLLPVYVREGRADTITPENLSTLDVLGNNGYGLAILTTRTAQEVQHLTVKGHPLHGRITAFYHKDNLRYRKPDPRVFGKILKRFTVAPEEAVYVGDTVSDAGCAKSAGLHFIASLESGLRTERDFENTGTDAFIRRFPELPDTIQKMNRTLR